MSAPDTPDFVDTFHELIAERQRLTSRRSELEVELNEVRNKIRHLAEVLDHLAPLANVDYVDDESISGLGITDAIRHTVKHAVGRMSAQDILHELQEKNYDFSDMTIPLASIYKILSRLTEAKEVKREKEEGRVYYEWIHPPISDEDIPF